MNEDFTYIKLYRRILNNPVVCKDADHFSIWVYLLLVATHTEREKIFKGKKITLNPGQLITGRIAISEKLSISQSKVQRVLKNLENEQQIEQQTSNRNRLITILNWNDYQGNEQQNEQQVNNKRTTSEQPVNTYKNDKNVKNDKKEIYSEISDLYNSICLSFPRLTKLSDARKKAIKARFNTYTIEDFRRLFTMAEESDFLKGKNDRNWSATFDWLIKDSNMAKVLDGNYKNTTGQQAKPKTTNKFNQFPQREYTKDQMAEIERKLLNKSLDHQAPYLKFIDRAYFYFIECTQTQ